MSRAARPDRAGAGRRRTPRRGLAPRAGRALPRPDRPALRRRRRLRHGHRRPGPSPGPARRGPGRRGRAAVRRTDGREGPQPHRRRPHHLRLGGDGRLRARRVRRGGHAAGGGRHDQPRQDQHPGVRLALLHRARRRTAGAHPLGPDPDGRRLQRRGRRGGGGGTGAGGAGVRRRWLDPDPGELLRAGRLQAESRADQRQPDVRRPGGPGHGRSARPHGPRRRRAARRDGRSGRRRPVVGGTAARRRDATSAGATASPAGCGSPASPTRSSPTSRSIPRCCGPTRTTSRLLESLGHEVEDVDVPLPPDAAPSSRPAGRC